MPAQEFSLPNIDAFVGRELGVSPWIRIDQRRIEQFADCTEDHQWIHTVVDRAKTESPLGTTIAHGYLTLAILAPSTFEVVVKPAGISQALNYGLDRVRGVVMRSQIIKANGEPVSVDYMMRQNGEDWLIADIYLDGTTARWRRAAPNSLRS